MSSISSFYNNNSNNIDQNMSKPSFFELKKQASFFIKEKIKTARLALTDVTPVQLHNFCSLITERMTEEATNANPWAPDTRTLGLISRAAFEVDDYWRIVDILHNKLAKFDRKNWRSSYNALIILEHLLTHGPERVAEEFQTEKFIINDMKIFQHVDEKGFNWGLAVRKKSDRILKLLESGHLLKEERENARKLTREIKGFGSFTGRSAKPLVDPSTAYGRSSSNFNEHGNEEDNYRESETYIPDDDVETDNRENMKVSLKENMAPRVDSVSKGRFHAWMNKGEEKSRLIFGGFSEQNYGRVSAEEEDHPFNETEKHSRVSLLAAVEEA